MSARFSNYFDEAAVRVQNRGPRSSNSPRRVGDLETLVNLNAHYSELECREVTRMFEGLDLRVRNLEQTAELRIRHQEHIAEVRQPNAPNPHEPGAAVGEGNRPEEAPPGRAAGADEMVLDRPEPMIHYGRAGPDANAPRDEAMLAMTQVITRVTAAVTTATVSALLDYDELFEGISDEDRTDLFAAAGVPRPHDGPDAAEVARRNGIIERNLVEFVLNAMLPRYWEDDDAFKLEYLRQLTADVKARAEADRDMWGRLFEFRRLSIEGRGRPRVRGMDADLEEFGHQIQEPAEEEEAPLDPSEARRAEMEKLVKSIRNSERTIQRAGRAIQLCQHSISGDATRLATLRGEEDRHQAAQMDAGMETPQAEGPGADDPAQVVTEEENQVPRPLHPERRGDVLPRTAYRTEGEGTVTQKRGNDCGPGEGGDGGSSKRTRFERD
ncbi:hypothetical protein PGT21_030302 [Puccinia graminis f. sp. tritici]|uniref:Uncharacterized protein n=1 Tax=Puccinia graminis f. sp. tritici TaxID=56615 RepID=A0A5B0PLQ1_PUCGR|nr:hypothetical protein PGT21_030302 [Puccinia graminis f. sp. tritici]